MKNCVFILPYFGKFKNYFPLFLKSCEKNKSFDWLIITDCKVEYNYPSNVIVKYISFTDWKEHIEKKFDFKLNLDAPYKLCDYKPSYGYILEDKISNYEYWGYCDCDLVFGDLEKFLIPLMKKGYDKIFAAGHLTLYKNNYDNNRRFMKTIYNRCIYKEVLSVREIKAFDEDLGGNNIHSIFLDDSASVFSDDLSANPSVAKSQFHLMKYDPNRRLFIEQSYKVSAFFWNNGKILEFYDNNGTLVTKEYLYMHLQMRNMSYSNRLLECESVQILPNVFIAQKIPFSLAEFKKIKKTNFNRQQFDLMVVRIKRKFKKFH